MICFPAITEEQLLDTHLRVTHIGYLSLYYLALIVTLYISAVIVDRKYIPISHDAKKILSLNPYIVIALYIILDSGAQYILGLGPKSSKPGFTVPHAAVFIYLERAVRLLVWVIVVNDVLGNKQQEGVKRQIFYGVIVLITLSIPGIILGQHKPLVLNLAQIVYLFCVGMGIEKRKITIRHILGIVALAVLSVASLWLMLVSTSIIRYGHLTPGFHLFSYVFNRITGITNGIHVVHYTMNKGETLPFWNYFAQLVKLDSATPISYYYVDTVMASSHDFTGGFARPAYASGLIYGSIGISIFLAIISGLVCGMAERIAYVKITKEKDYLNAGVLIYVLMNVYWSTVIDGNVDDLTTYLFVALIALIVVRLLHIDISFGKTNNENKT